MANFAPTQQAAILCGLFCFICPQTAHALPSDFNDKLEATLLCRADWSTVYWQDYLSKHLQKPVRDWGEARWWNSQGATFGGIPSTEIFLNLDTSRALMLGVLLPQPVEAVRKALQTAYGVRFEPVTVADGVRYVSAEASVLVGLADKQNTKWYCAKWNLGNRP